MMKKGYLLVLLLAASSVYAQPVLDGNNHIQLTWPASGEINSNASSLSPGSAGANQTWDFSHWWGTSYTSALQNYSGTDYPLANRVSVQSGSKHYFLSDNVQFSLVAMEINLGNGTLFLHYTDPLEMLVFPMTFGQVHRSSLFANGRNGSLTYTESGTTTLEYDGYGTLILPDATYEDAMRIKNVQIYASPSMGTSQRNETYTWYIPSFHAAVASYSTSTVYVNGSPAQTIQSASYRYNQTVGIGEPSTSSWQFGPNPARENVTFTNLPSETTSLSLFDLQGRMVRQLFIENQINVKLPVADLPSGVYLVRLESPNGIHTEKLLVE